MLTVSFSSNDYVGHRVGPDAPEVRDMAIRTDQLLAKLFRAIDEKLGLGNVIFVLSADHGVATVPDPRERMPGGYLTAHFEEVVISALNQRFGKADWLLPSGGAEGLYFNRQAIENAKNPDGTRANEQEVYRAAKAAIFAAP